MSKKIASEKRLEKSIERIEKVFNWVANDGFAVADKKKKKGVDPTTREDYEQKTMHFMKKYYEIYKEPDITKIDIENGNKLMKELYGKNAYSIQHQVHAIHFFQEAAVKSQVFKESVSLIDKKEMLGYCRENKLVRKAEDSTTLKATHEQIDRVVEELHKSKSPFKEQAIQVLEMGRHFGTRISGALAMTGKDITVRSEEASLHIFEKGKHHRWVDIDQETAVRYAESLKDSLDDNQGRYLIKPLRYTTGDHRGQIMDNRTSGQRLAHVIEEAAERAGVNTDEKSFSAHSCRGTFTQDRINHYANKSLDHLVHTDLRKKIEKNNDLQKELAEQGFKITDIESKMATLVHRINHVNATTRRTTEDREANHKELCLFLASLDTGHYRTDVIRFYGKYLG
ncbi:tyrosine-type recombinase/integrase [Paenibacillus sp. GP183]|uniref:tyrosine-type recombinase/integrase n=1 Tax=Paenibacillus sp. GP183 TaxID=1882751 RepID=UPI0008966A42|nr:tyrosine-type recombinase/integrase [Paenibacillus sp. GP183]SED18010.1 Phage integrase family protein [Paenibacillus sp. GP183]